MTGLYLGNVEFRSFELPERVVFGGAQQLAVHTLIGGRRVIDVLGRDDLALRWSGVLSGTDASERARLLDGIRVGGLPQTVSWDAFCYVAFLTELRLSYCNPWWIPYEIRCIVQADLAQAVQADVPDRQSAILDDLSTAAGLLTGSAGPSIAAASGFVSGGSGFQVQALSMLSAARSQSALAIDDDAGQLGSADLSQIAAAAGAIANASCGSGYLNRAYANLQLSGG